MTTQQIIGEIQAKNPNLNKTQILEMLQTERDKTGGLLSDETLLRLVAARFGVNVKQSLFKNTGVLSSSRLFAGLYDVNFEGRVFAVYPVKIFKGEEKTGKLASLIVADNDGLLRVVLWNEHTALVENGQLEVGKVVKLLHGYTREDRYGKIELHLSNKSQIELQPESKIGDYPSIEQYVTKIGSLKLVEGNVHLLGVVKAVLSKSIFHRNDAEDGIVLRVVIRDDSGEVNVVVWNEKVAELEKKLRDSTQMLLINAHVKPTKNDCIEVHVDFNTVIDIRLSTT